jgi:hypothetical protein
MLMSLWRLLEKLCRSCKSWISDWGEEVLIRFRKRKVNIVTVYA